MSSRRRRNNEQNQSHQSNRRHSQQQPRGNKRQQQQQQSKKNAALQQQQASDAFAAQQLARVQAEQQQLKLQQQADPNRNNNNSNSNTTTEHRTGKQLWNTVKKKPVTLSQKNRALEDAVKVLMQRLADNDLDTTVDGEEPISPDEEVLKLKNQITQLQEQCKAAAAHKRAAELFEKQYRDCRAELEKWKDGKKDIIQQLTLKESELKLSADAGALARKDVMEKTTEIAAKDIQITEHLNARNEAERDLQKAKHTIELMKKQLIELRQQLLQEQESKEKLQVQTDRLNSHLAALETSNKALMEQSKENQENNVSNELMEELKQNKLKMESMNDEKNRLNTRILAQEAEIQRLLELEKALSLALKQHETTVTNLEDRTNELKALTEQLDISKKEHIQTKIQLSEMEKVLKDDKKTYTEEILQLKNQNIELKEQNVVVVQERDAALVLNTSLTEEIEKLKLELKEKQDVFEMEKNKYTDEIKALKIKMKEFEIELKSKGLKEVQDDATDQAKKTTEEMLALEKQLKDALSAIQNKEKEIVELNSKIQNINDMYETQIQKMEKIQNINITLDAKLKVANEGCDVLNVQLEKMTKERDDLKIQVNTLGLNASDSVKDLNAKHEAASSLRRLAESLQVQLDEANVSHEHLVQELKRESMNLKCTEEERDEWSSKYETLKKNEQDLENEKINLENELSTLESTIETLSTQLGSLVDSGEAFEENAQKREDNLMHQIKRLRRGRQKDREAYKTAVEANNAWKIRAENAESMVANKKASSIGKLNKEFSKDRNRDRDRSRDKSRGRNSKRPTPPPISEAMDKEDTSSISSARSSRSSKSNTNNSTPRNGRQRKYVSSNANAGSSSLPPVASASPSPIRLQAPS